jgi:uncharacterized protein YndB with AHSA1/START domain
MAVKNEATTQTQGKELTIVREFDAPRELVWKAWSDPELLKQWWGPKTFTTPAYTIDFRVGGTYLHCMRSPEGQDYWATGTYREIVPMERIVFTDAFADENGNVVPASHYGMEGDWADDMLVTLTFEDLNGKTRLTLCHTGIPEGQLRDMTGAGWNESFDKLAARLANR